MATTGAARQYCESLFKGLIAEQSFTATTGASIVQVVNNDAERVALLFVNTGANPAYLWIDETVSNTNGILLAASGGFLSMNVTTDFTFPSRNWWAAQSGGATTIVALAIRRINETTE